MADLETAIVEKQVAIAAEPPKGADDDLLGAGDWNKGK